MDLVISKMVRDRDNRLGGAQVTTPALLEQLREIRSTWLWDKRVLSKRVAAALGWLAMQRPHGPNRTLLERVEVVLRRREIPDLADILAIEDLLRVPGASRHQASATITRDGRRLGIAFDRDLVVTIARLDPEIRLLDRGRLSKRGHLVEVGGSPELRREDYEAIEATLRGWLT